MTLILFLFVLFFVGVPIGFALGMTALAGIFISGFQPLILVQRMFTGVDSIALTAIPLFILAGELMYHGGMSRRMVNFADTLMGHMASGIAMAAILACTFFALITGSAIAATAAIGGIMIPLMTEKNYEPTFSAPLLACGGTIGAVFPPSIPLLVYGVLANVSVGALFVGGFIPGILMSLSLLFVTYRIGKKRNYKGRETKASLGEVAKAGLNALLALLMPVIIIGGILGGWFTPTESATIAVAYAFVVGALIYRELKLKNMFQILVNSAKSTGLVLMIVAFASLFTWVITVNQIPQQISAVLRENIHSPIVMLLLINVVLLLAGSFIDTISAIVIFAPLFLPLVRAFNIDPVHFGLIMVMNLSIGMATPPLGVCLFVSGSIAKVSLREQLRDLIPMVIAMLIALLIVTYVPQTVLFLPNLLR